MHLHVIDSVVTAVLKSTMFSPLSITTTTDTDQIPPSSILRTYTSLVPVIAKLVPTLAALN